MLLVKFKGGASKGQRTKRGPMTAGNRKAIESSPCRIQVRVIYLAQSLIAQEAYFSSIKLNMEEKDISIADMM